MAARTSSAQVLEVMSTSLNAGQIQAFINDANLWVTEELSDVGLTFNRLELIERYLACALVRLRDLGLKSATFENVSESYQVDPQVTDYLNRAASFDPSGRLRLAFLSPPNAGKPVIFGTGTTFNAALEKTDQ